MMNELPYDDLDVFDCFSATTGGAITCDFDVEPLADIYLTCFIYLV